MCLGIPGQIVELHPTHDHLARADVSGVGRMINIGLLEDEHLVPGDWVLIHVGFAMSKIDQAEADLALASLQMMGEMFTDEVEALMASPSSTTTGAIPRGVSEQWE
ncbi:MAG: HypC/HybG/HupF family hydrogenase formation chaperone [Ilumatobacteraceae bacterium]